MKHIGGHGGDMKTIHEKVDSREQEGNENADKKVAARRGARSYRSLHLLLLSQSKTRAGDHTSARGEFLDVAAASLLSGPPRLLSAALPDSSAHPHLDSFAL